MNKKTIHINVPLHIKQQVKIKDGKNVEKWEWNVPARLFYWLSSLLPRKVSEEVGAEYKTFREEWFHIGENGQLEPKKLQEINEEIEILKVGSAVSITVTENETENNGSLIEITQK